MSSPLWARGEPVTDWDVLDQHPDESTALIRLWRGFMGARCFVALVLVLLQGVAFAIGQTMQPVAIAISALYLVATWLGMRYRRVQPPIRGFAALWLLTIGIDLAAFTALQVLQGGSVNYTPLFALPVLMSAVLGTMIVSLGTTATVTLLLLADAGWHWLQQPVDSSARFVQA
ncbi:MAG: PAS domain-containing sensor histidine kinase, partial [Variovorax sp.]